MFLDFYQMHEQPFGVTPDPKYLYLSRMHREALASLFYGIEAGRGFMALVAHPGMGKTTLLFQLLERVRKSAHFAFLFQTQCNSQELLRYLLADLGLECRVQDPVVIHDQLQQALLRMKQSGKRFVLVVDEAQNLEESVLETIRLLSDFETSTSKLVQIVLSGQPQLGETLTKHTLAQLRQRISILSRLSPFGPEDVSRYIDHRLWVAGYRGRPLFTPEARALIATHSKGIPRTINNICFNALSTGFALGRKTIDAEVVREALGDLDFEALNASHRAPAPAAHPSLPAPRVRPNPPKIATLGHWVPTTPTLVAGLVVGGLLSGFIFFGRPTAAPDHLTPAASSPAPPVASDRLTQVSEPHPGDASPLASVASAEGQAKGEQAGPSPMALDTPAEGIGRASSGESALQSSDAPRLLGRPKALNSRQLSASPTVKPTVNPRYMETPRDKSPVARPSQDSGAKIYSSALANQSSVPGVSTNTGLESARQSAAVTGVPQSSPKDVGASPLESQVTRAANGSNVSTDGTSPGQTRGGSSLSTRQEAAEDAHRKSEHLLAKTMKSPLAPARIRSHVVDTAPPPELSPAQKAELRDKLIIAEFFMDRSDYRAAEQAFEEALEIDPSNRNAQSGAARARQARGALQTGSSF